MDAIDEFMNRMGVLFGPPDTYDLKAFAAEYRAVLAFASLKDIARAGDELRDTHQSRVWPTPAQVLAALKRVLATAPTDFDEIERERSMGWRFSDLQKSAKSDADRAAVQKLVDDWLQSIRDRDIARMDDSGVDFRRGQRDQFEDMQRNSPNTVHRGKS